MLERFKSLLLALRREIREIRGPSDDEIRHSLGRMDDFSWCMRTIECGLSIEDTAAQLLQRSAHAKASGENYALETAKEAAAHVVKSQQERQSEAEQIRAPEPSPQPVPSQASRYQYQITSPAERNKRFYAIRITFRDPIKDILREHNIRVRARITCCYCWASWTIEKLHGIEGSVGGSLICPRCNRDITLPTTAPETKELQNALFMSAVNVSHNAMRPPLIEVTAVEMVPKQGQLGALRIL